MQHTDPKDALKSKPRYAYKTRFRTADRHYIITVLYTVTISSYIHFKLVTHKCIEYDNVKAKPRKGLNGTPKECGRHLYLPSDPG